MKFKHNQGFTLIELLVVVGILSVLAIAALIAINPIEAQRRARDSARMQDAARLTSTIEQYFNDYGIPAGGNIVVNSIGAGKVRSHSCSSNWTGLDLCDYLKQVPVDPQNSLDISILKKDGTRAKKTASYELYIEGSTGEYEFCMPIEANKNIEILDDGGNRDNAFETGSTTTLACNPYN